LCDRVAAALTRHSVLPNAPVSSPNRPHASVPRQVTGVPAAPPHRQRREDRLRAGTSNPGVPPALSHRETPRSRAAQPAPSLPVPNANASAFSEHRAPIVLIAPKSLCPTVLESPSFPARSLGGLHATQVLRYWCRQLNAVVGSPPQFRRQSDAAFSAHRVHAGLKLAEWPRTTISATTSPSAANPATP